MMFFLYIAAIVLGTIQAFTHEDANEYIEGVLANRFQEEAKYSRLDPYRLDRFDLKLNLTGRPSGKATLSKASIINLSKVKRAGDCTIPFWQSANITFTCFLQFEHLRVNYTVNATYDNMEVLFYPHVALRGTNITIQVTTSKYDNIPSLSLIFVNHIGSINVTADMISIGDSAQIVGPPIREAIVKHSIQKLDGAINNGKWKQALAYSIYKSPIEFLSD